VEEKTDEGDRLTHVHLAKWYYTITVVKCIVVLFRQFVCDWADKRRMYSVAGAAFRQVSYLACASATKLQTCGGCMTLFAAAGRSHLDATWSVSAVFCCKLFWLSSNVTS